jgi:SnoaL-like domain
MDESNIEVLGLMTGEWNRRGLDAMIENFWQEDVEWIDAPDMPDPVTVHGRDEVAARLQSIRDVLGHWELEILEIRPTGEECEPRLAPQRAALSRGEVLSPATERGSTAARRS